MTEETLFHEALAKANRQDRSAFLDAACAGEPELRSAVEALLAAHDRPVSFLNQTAVAPPDAARDRAPDAEGPGSMIGPYKLLEQIGEGGFGVVFMAEQQRPMRRKVALKVIKPGMDTRQVVARFEAERQALALMEHTNIARVFDSGETASGRPYFVMELVKGIPITRYCDERQLTPRERLALFIPVCQAVQHAHLKGIIHRDLKPSNVLVAAYDPGAPAVPKVIDFGVAKALGQPLTEQTLATGFGGIVGTLQYMSPEQADFNALDVDTRSDIYGLGVLLYELLAGTTPVTKERLHEAAVTDALRLIREEEPPTPSTRLSDSKDSLTSISAQRKLEPDRLTRELRGELDWIVMKCLEKDRNRRYETANGVARDIERYLGGDPVEAGPPSATYRLRKFLNRNKRPVLAAALAIVMLVVGIIGTTTGMVRAERQRKRADDASDRAQRHLALSQSNLDLAVAAVNQFCTKVSEDVRLKEHDLRPLRQDLLKSAVEFHGQLLERRGKSDMARIDLARAYHRLAQLTAEIEDHDRAIALYRQAIDEFDELLQKRKQASAHNELAWSLGGLARLLVSIGQYKEAEPVLDRAEAMLDLVLESDPDQSGPRSQLALLLEAKAWSMTMTQRHADSRQISRQAIAHYERLTEDDPGNVEYWSKLAGAHRRLGKSFIQETVVYWRDSEAEYQTALAIQRRAVTMPGASEYDRQVLGLILVDLGVVEKVTSRNDQAILRLKEAIQLFETLKRDQPSVLSFADDLAIAYRELAKCESLAGRTDAKLNALRTAVEIWDRLVTRAPGNSVWESNYAQALHHLGETTWQQGGSDSALLHFDRSVELLDAILRREPQSHNANAYLPPLLIDRGKLLASMGRFDEAVADCNRTVQLAPEDRRDFYRVERALIIAFAGEHEAAVSEARESLGNLAARCDPRRLRAHNVIGARACAHAAALVQADTGLAAPERERLFAEYVANSIDMLRSALDAGVTNIPAVRESAEFAMLRERPEFNELFDRKSEQTNPDK